MPRPPAPAAAAVSAPAGADRQPCSPLHPSLHPQHHLPLKDLTTPRTMSHPSTSSNTTLSHPSTSNVKSHT